MNKVQYTKCPHCGAFESHTRIYCGKEYKGCLYFCDVPPEIKDCRNGR